MKERKIIMNDQKGFTLIEVMVVVAIIGILAAFAIPAYQKQVLKSNRVSAESKMLEMAGILERNYTQNGQYIQGFVNGLNGATTPALPSDCLAATPYNNRYTICVALGVVAGVAPNRGSQTYTITATRVGAQVSDSCGELTLNNANQKGVIGGGSVNMCWR